jgi:transcriptional regulator with XRE-family HTH domain
VTPSGRGDYDSPGNAGDYAVAVGARLRAVRQAQGLSLDRVQHRSGGRIKQVVIASYERANRSATVGTLAGIADWYDVPVSELVPDSRIPTPAGGYHRARLTLDLDRLRALGQDPEMRLLSRYVAAIQAWRRDWAACVLSIRATDVSMLAIMHETTPAGLIEHWAGRGVLAGNPKAGGG